LNLLTASRQKRDACQK